LSVIKVETTKIRKEAKNQPGSGARDYSQVAARQNRRGEFEQGKGGSLRYCFDIIEGSIWHEDWAEAKTGIVFRSAK
jgi:hypothetical protein